MVPKFRMRRRGRLRSTTIYRFRTAEAAVPHASPKNALIAIPFNFAVEIEYVQDEQAIDGEDDSRGNCGVDCRSSFVMHERIHGRSEQPA